MPSEILFPVIILKSFKLILIIFFTIAVFDLIRQFVPKMYYSISKKNRIG